jgi:hypothetical protein
MLGPLQTVAGGLFGAVSALRGRKRSLHPHGVAFTAALRVDEGAPLPAGRHDAVVRLSRGVGLPQPLPDVLGVAIKAYLPAGEQDLLLATSLDGPVLHHLLVPTAGFTARPFSSSLPFASNGALFVVGALPEAAAAAPPGNDLERAVALIGRRGLAYRLVSASLTGRWGPPWARLTPDRRLPDADAERLRFNPYNAAGGLRPAGALNLLRRGAYPGSQLGRRT